jgi:hypothetical protein
MADLNRSTVGTGAVAGVVAVALEYLVVYVWTADSVQDSLAGLNAIAEFVGADPIPTWKGVGWLFYNAHAVPFHYPTLVGGRASENAVASGEYSALLYLVPVLGLLAAGTLLARRAAATDVGDGAVAGATVTAGYAPVALAGVWLVRVERSAGTVGPDLATALLLAALVYPLALGGAGGALAAALRD